MGHLLSRQYKKERKKMKKYHSSLVENYYLNPLKTKYMVLQDLRCSKLFRDKFPLSYFRKISVFSFCIFPHY